MGIDIYGNLLRSRMILGTALYPTMELMLKAIEASKVDMVTVSLKRELNAGTNNFFWDAIKSHQLKVLPNTAGCRNADEAITIARAAREIFNTNLIKLEVIGDDYTLQPDSLELLKATEILLKEGFQVLPYCNDDLITCKKLISLGCKVIMPYASYIGSGQGIVNPQALALLVNRFPDTSIIVDAGIGTPSDAVKAMEIGVDGIILNSAVALSDDPQKMAEAFSLAIISGRLAYEAKRMPKRDFAKSSTPLQDTPFWHQPFQA